MSNDNKKKTTKSFPRNTNVWSHQNNKKQKFHKNIGENIIFKYKINIGEKK